MRTLGGNALWNLAGVVAHTASQWAILIVLAKAGNSKMVGQVALGLAIATPVFFFFNLGLRQVLATDAKTEYPPRLYSGIRLTTSLIALAVVAVAGLLFSTATETWRVILLIGAVKGCGALSELCYGLFQKMERLDYVGRSLIVRGITSVAAVAIGLRLSGRVEVAVSCWLAVWAAALLLHDLRLFLEHSRPRELLCPMPSTAGRLVREALPLGIAGMLVAFNLNMPRYWLAHFHGEVLLGLFVAAAYIPMSGRRVLEALGQAAMPRLARLWATDKRAEYRRLLLQLVAIGSGCAVTGFLVVFFWGGPLLTLVYTKEYAEHSRILVWLMASWGLRYPSAFLAGGLVATRRFLLVPRVYIPSVVAAVVSGALLIPQHGILGAAWADMISAVLQLILTIFVGRDLLAVKATG